MAGGEKPDLEQDYHEAGFGNRLGFGEAPALLVVDFIKAYMEPDSPLYAGVEDELKTAQRVLAAARKAEIPVIFTCVEYTPGGADGGLFYKKVGALKHLDRGGRLGAFAEGLEPDSNEVVVTKQYASAFFGTSLASTLNAMGRDCVIVTGLTTSGCVRATALDALQYGFIPLVVADACGDRDEAVQKANIFDLGAKYADIVSAETVCGWLAQR